MLVNVNNVGVGLRESEVNGGDVGRGGVSTTPKNGDKGTGSGRMGKDSGRKMGEQDNSRGRLY